MPQHRKPNRKQTSKGKSSSPGHVSSISSISSWSDFFKKSSDKSGKSGKNRRPRRQDKSHGRRQNRGRSREPSDETQDAPRRRSLSLTMPPFPQGIVKDPVIPLSSRNNRRDEHLLHIQKAQNFTDFLFSNMERVADDLSENCTLMIHDQTGKIPFCGIFHGKSSIRDGLKKWLSHMITITASRGETYNNRGFSRILITVDVHQQSALNVIQQITQDGRQDGRADIRHYAAKIFFSFDFDSNHNITRVDIYPETGPLVLLPWELTASINSNVNMNVNMGKYPLAPPVNNLLASESQQLLPTLQQPIRHTIYEPSVKVHVQQQ